MCYLNYIPPTITQYENLFDFLNGANIGYVNLNVLGDFNTPDIDWSTLSGFSPDFAILFLTQSYLNLSTVLLKTS